MFGKILIYLIFALSIASGVFYFSSLKKEKLIKVAEILYYALALCFVFVSGFMMYNIFAHNYQYTYIWQYSSNELPNYLLFTSFYSGQEGSFMLWGLLVTLFGLIVQPYAKKYGYQNLVMGFYALIITFIAALMISKSPFNFVWESFADSGLAVGFLPKNGKGLNPILENYWNAIHPPILFIGYAAMSVPFVFSIAGLIKREHKNWINVATPWTLAAIGALGLGLMLGGFWAYETLGWGGFWGWDPVENSSLLPWLVATALAHTMLVQRKTGGLIRTNYVLASIAFLLVLYATFLTRSGVLGDMSVHSFGEPGKFVYVLLLAFVATFLLISLVTLFLRMKDISAVSSKIDFKFSSKEFVLSLGSLVILALSVIVFLGTSWPIIQEITGQAKSSIETAFYNKWTLPFGIGILVINAISLYMNWKESDMNKVLNKQIIAFVLAALAMAASFSFGVKQLEYLLLIFACTYSILVNVYFVFVSIKKSPRYMGAYLSHFGVSILILGALTSGAFSSTSHVELKLGQSKQVLGYNVKFTGKEQIEKEKKDREKYEFYVEVEKNGKKETLKPIFYWSSFNEMQAPFLEPGISESLTEDIYVSPKSVSMSGGNPSMVLGKGQTELLPYDSATSVTLNSFDMSAGMTMDENNKMKMGTVLKFKNSNKEWVDTLYSLLDVSSMTGEPVIYNLPGTDIQIGFTELVRGQDISQMKAAFTVFNKNAPVEQPKEIMAFDFSIKPYINFVWVGAILSVIGFFIAILKYKNTTPVSSNE